MDPLLVFHLRARIYTENVAIRMFHHLIRPKGVQHVSIGASLEVNYLLRMHLLRMKFVAKTNTTNR